MILTCKKLTAAFLWYTAEITPINRQIIGDYFLFFQKIRSDTSCKLSPRNLKSQLQSLSVYFESNKKTKKKQKKKQKKKKT